MKAFLLSIAVLVLVTAGAHFGMRPYLETSAGEAYSTPDVRLD